ncbi:MAG TPA: MoxR family ATPase [Planctomycetota bacterium]|nr:MoxR family ATPase [Planctomycetota bacterium]
MAPDTDAKAAEPLGSHDLEELAGLRDAHGRVRAELARVIVGQDDVIHQLLIAVISQGHCILEGVPGLAKTLMVSTLASALELSFHRIQFTPDLMPSDITGTEVIQENKATGGRELRFLPGPVFANVILADEINRTPPKTQAALLESMQEKQVTIGGVRHVLPIPFFVLATQNPIEQEGTYPLPEAQQDRFMFKLFVRYPSFDEEYKIAETTTAIFSAEVSQVLTGDQILRLQDIVRRVPVAPHVIRYALRLVRATRVSEGDVPDFITQWVTWGAGPRAVQYLLLGGKARAALDGRTFVTTDDVRAIAHPVLRHRIITNFNAESEGITTDRIVDRLLETIPATEEAEVLAGEAARAFTPEPEQE